MRTLYLECSMGAAGDMLMSALSELIDKPQDFTDEFNRLGLQSVILKAEKTQKCGIMGTHISVYVKGITEDEHIHKPGQTRHEHEHEHGHGHSHSHSSLTDIENIISGLDVSQKVKENATAVYRILAEAEGYVHGKEPCNIHFHEVGTLDAVADIVGVCMLMEKVNAERILASPVNVGSGQVRCAHGILPVPAPATAYILRDVPIYGGEINGELCTPTGAALLKHFVSGFTSMPQMITEKIGYGMGTKDFETANCVRAFLGEETKDAEEITELACNIDDMTGEAIGFAAEELLSSGALDVFTVPTVMKKGRPGIMLSVLCKAEQKEKMLKLIFRHTSTLGIREYHPKRYVLSRREVTLETPYGDICGKYSEGYGVRKLKAEYEELKELARKNGIALSDIIYSEKQKDV